MSVNGVRPLLVAGAGYLAAQGYGRDAQHYTESVFQISDTGYLIDNAPSASLADSGDKQAAVQEFVKNQSSSTIG
jgi:hypothetical protein